MPEQLQVRVISIQWKSDSVRGVELRRVDGGALPPFDAGSHIDLHLPNGLVRSYSLTNPPWETDRYVLGVAKDRASRGGSVYVHEQLRVGETLRITPPRNLFALHEGAPAILIGGGIGVTPLVSMAARLEQTGVDWALHYAVRTRSEAALLNDLAAFGDHIHLHCDDTAGGVLNLAGIVAAASPETHLYCCGPAPMMATFGDLTRAIASERVHVEHFTPIESAAVQGGYLVELARSARTVAIPQGSTILEALANAGVTVPSSCRQGVCGTCETRVLAGVPDHRDSILTLSERASNATMMVCCSGSKSEKLVLDI